MLQWQRSIACQRVEYVAADRGSHRRGTVVNDSGGDALLDQLRLELGDRHHREAGGSQFNLEANFSPEKASTGTSTWMGPAALDCMDPLSELAEFRYTMPSLPVRP